MQRPSARELDKVLRDAARGIAERIRDAGGSAWIVGGATRDMALGHRPHEVDLATDLVPDRIEALFEQTVGVGKAFGTMIVIWKGLGVEVTTFRSEHGYSDSRRPDEVTYGSSVEEDAARRDFTCNALYLDPLTDEFRDPVRGFEDLEAGVLRCVGEARERFREDGLRILRLVRFAARLDLRTEPETLEAARAELDSLRGVSAERVRGEFEKIFRGPRPDQAFRALRELGAHDRCLPGWLDGELGDARLRQLGALTSVLTPVLGLAALLDPDPSAVAPPDAARAIATLEWLRPSRELRRAVLELWRLQGPIEAAATGSASRAARLRLYREPAWLDALALFRARGVGAVEGTAALRAESEALSEEALHPPALLSAQDLLDAGVERGPRLGELLRALEDEQLEGRVTDADAARAWLADQLGGNQRRSDQASG
ncbi:MAG: CCA tRNA nucleotidyltransferase [Planctomycetes bacterium]|nr:CCA tRNA nucleotidyltransferase [Planctomycetota bacterium]MCB9904018.1 CCA tRNA nucleotidyltransferase [Planctomycetota bacterium]